MNIVQRAYRKLRRESVDVIYQSAGKAGVYNDFYKKVSGNRILVYHGLCQKDHTRFNPIFLTCKTFESHLRFFKKYFNVVSLDDFFCKRFVPGKFNICLSFDDGFANNFRYALPLLEQYEMPATFFITSIRETGYDVLWNDFLNMVTRYGPSRLEYKGQAYSKNRFGRYVADADGKALAESLRSTDFMAKEEMMHILKPLARFRDNPADADYWELITETQIKQLSLSPLVTIGSHGYYHNDLAMISPIQAQQEIIQSKAYLERITGKEIKSLAFPYGSYNGEVRELAKKNGFSQLLATDFLLTDDATDPTMRERFTINPFIHVHSQMQAIIKGNYEQWK
jgi:peptidoglycan/xylan/chitin deacetylase (PgdA/CDA1 family)